MSYQGKIPNAYRRPSQDVIAARETTYWITEVDHLPGTQLYSVIGVDDDGQHIVAERCYLHWAIRIVDGLRAIGEVT